MTMQNASHPDDERLAAYAGGDRDAVADPSLTEHISSCDRCGPMVDELAGLRTALAAMPDLAPSRPLRLIPPVPAASATPLGWPRRLAGPAMAAGAGLVLIGAIGLGQSAVGNAFKAVSGGNLQEAAASGRDAAASDSAAHAPQPAASGETSGTTDSGSSAAPRSLAFGPETSPTPLPAETGRSDYLTGAGSSPEQPWLTLLIAGVALFGTSAILRFSVTPGAG